MPTYEYACTSCGQHVEVFQRFSEPPLTTCGVCGGVLRKVFHPAGIVFKGSGFYATDSRSTAKTSAGEKGSGSSDGSATPGSTDGAAKPAPKPAPETASGSKTPAKERSA
jgi:putative FmdB family regulatory protein